MPDIAAVKTLALEDVEPAGEKAVAGASLAAGDRCPSLSASDTATVRKYLDTDGDARRAYEEWADAHNELQKLNDYGAELAFGYAELEGPLEARHPEAKAEMAGSSDAA